MTVSVSIVTTRSIHNGRCSTFKLKHFHRIVFFTHAEYFEIAKTRFLGFCVTIHFDAKEIALILPVKLALRGEINQPVIAVE